MTNQEPITYVYGRYKMGWGIWRKTDRAMVSTSQFRKGIFGIVEEIKRVTGTEVQLERVQDCERKFA